MSFFISDAVAAAAPAAQDPGYAGLLLPLGLFLFFYLFFILPQSKRSKEHKKMLENLSKGAEVVTNGGLLGKVVDLDENFVQVEVAEDTVIQVQRHAISSMMPKGTYKVQNKKLKAKS